MNRTAVICMHVIICVYVLVIQAAGAVVVPGLGGAADFSRYQSIIDRKPFGNTAVQEPSRVVNPAVAQADLFTKTLKMVAIKLEKSGKTRVGFINQAAGNKSYYMCVGEVSADGIEVVDADFKQESALLKKETQTGWIYMGHTSKAGSKNTLASERAASSMAKRSRAKTAVSEMKDRISSYESERTKAEMEAMKAPRLQGEALEAHLKEVQMDAIRNGLPPLPMPLTEEMDAQLVAEGVLPPQ